MSIYEGYLSFGGNELVNNTRTRGIAESAKPCPLFWLKGDVCATMNAALFEEAAYSYETIDFAPWYDADIPAARDFYGFFAYSITEALDSTRSVSRTEGVSDGGFLGRTRKATKTMRVRGLLMGRGRQAIEYGQAWLSAAVDPGACGQHGTECGLTDLEWFVDCPPARGWVTVPSPDPEEEPTTRPQTDAEYAATVDGYRRYLHDVACLSGPLITGTLAVGDFMAYEVEMVFGAERPWVYGATRDIALPPSTPVVIQDIPYNLVPYPSAELAAGEVTIARNLSLNPSVETNATGWVTSVAGAITGGMVTSGRVTGELAAVGVAAFRSVFTATGASGAAGSFANEQEVALTGRPVGGRVSINVWAAELVMGGAPVRTPIEVEAIWRASSGGAALRTDALGTIPVNGGSVSVKSILPPPTATHVLVRTRGPLTSWNAGTIVRLYTDALAVTIP